MSWNTTYEDLMEELKTGKRQRVSWEELELATAYTKQMMPKGIRYPKHREVYEAVSDYPVRYSTFVRTGHCAGVTFSGDSILPSGERVEVDDVSENPEPIKVLANPLRYDELHEQIVPASERYTPGYHSYFFEIPTVDLNRYFRLIETPESFLPNPATLL